MDRTAMWMVGLMVCLGGVAAACCGCQFVPFAMYVIKGTNVDAMYDGLRDKRVVVVCRPVVDLKYSNSSAAHDVGLQVEDRLRQNVRKIDVVDQQEVDRWTDENAWESYEEIGAALHADVVLAIELEAFSLYDGQTLYRGRANVTMKVIDVATGEVLFEQIPPQTVYPPNVGISVSERQEPTFRREFVGELSEEIGRYFYAHDTRVDFAKDAVAYQHQPQ